MQPKNLFEFGNERTVIRKIYYRSVMSFESEDKIGEIGESEKFAQRLRLDFSQATLVQSEIS